MSELSFPLPLSEFTDRFRHATATCYADEPVALSRTQGGDVARASLGSELWQGAMTAARLRHDDAAEYEALFSLLKRAGASFLVRDTRYAGPRSDRGGVALTAPARNRLTNSRLDGAALGTLDAAGALPTTWGRQNIALADVEVVAQGIEDGRPTVRVRINGTPTSAVVAIFMCSNICTPAEVGQQWVGSVWAQLVAGSLTNVTSLQLRVYSNEAGGTFIANDPLGPAWGPLATLTRYGGARVLDDATVGRVQPVIAITTTGPVDLTLKLQAPQLELGGTATDFEPTPRAPELDQLDSGNRLIALRGLPVGYVLSPGDMVGWTYGSQTRYALHRLVTGATADGAGRTALFEVTPRVRGGVAGAAAELVKPVCKAVVDQIGYGAGGRVFTAGGQIAWIQTVK